MRRISCAGGGVGRLWVGVSVAWLSGCAAGTAVPSSPTSGGAAPNASAERPRAGSDETARDPERTVAEADGVVRDQLAVQGRDPRFSTDRQVVELRRAIVLYEQFIARAEADPRFDEAVRRSRDRVADAKATIDFLLQEAAGSTAATP